MEKFSKSRNMKVLVMGCGNIGSVAAEDIATSLPSVEVVVADKDERRAKQVAKKIDASNVSWIISDVAKPDEMATTLKEYNLTMGFLPSPLGYRLAQECIKAQKDLVDVSYMPENMLELNEEAAQAGSTLIPDCGLAPGISNVLAGRSASMLDDVQSIHIMVGGLPERPKPPLGYAITWSPESLIDEYTRKAGIVRNGRIIKVEALSGLEEIEVSDVGKLEAFYTDGLRTLVHTMKHVPDMWEKTLRYPGHAEKIKLLRNIGFLNEEKIDVDGIEVQPKKFTAKIFEKTLSSKTQEDIVVMRIETQGTKNGRRIRCVYRMLDYCDKKRGVTSMARTTAYPASIAAQLLLKKAVKEKGVIPPEKIGMDEKLFKFFQKGLSSHGIRIEEEITKT